MRISDWSSDVCSSDLFPANIGQGEMPPLFVIGAEGDAQLVNYRVRSPYLIVDRLFGAAELRLGGKQPQLVRIEPSDSTTSRGTYRRRTIPSNRHCVRTPIRVTSTPGPHPWTAQARRQ